MRRAWALAAALLLPAPAARALAAEPKAASRRADASFEVDPRVELLSAVLMLAAPEDFARRTEGLKEPYLEEFRAAFARLSSHPAVASAAARLKRGVPPRVLAETAIQSRPPSDAFAAELKDFEKRSNFRAFFAAHREAYRAFAETARLESLRSIPPDAAAAYAGRPFEGPLHFILAPLLSGDAAGGRLRPGERSEGGRIGFGFDSFERSVSHELLLASFSWLLPPSREISEHLALAVGLRTLAQDLGESSYRALLSRPSLARFPQLENVAEGLKDYEASPEKYPTLESFYPRLAPMARLRLDEAAAAALAGDRARALALIAAARASSPDLNAGRRIVEQLQALTRYDEAQAYLDGLIKSAPADARLRLDGAVLAARKGDRQAALDGLVLARRLDRSPAIDRGAAQLYQELEEFERELEPLDALLKAAPGDVRLRIERASVAALAGRRAEAVAGLGEARRLKPDRDCRSRMASLYQYLKDDKQAGLLFDGLIKESPADPGLRLERASLAAQAGDRETALKFLGEARALNPDAGTRRRMAVLYRDLKAFDQAKLLLDGLLTGGAADAGLRLERAALAAAAGDRAAALASLAEARRLGPDAAGLRRMETLYGQLNEFSQESALLDERIKAAPNDPALRLDRARLSIRSGDRQEYAAARSLLDGLVKEFPHDAGLRLERAVLASRMGDRQAALDSLAEAKKLSPSREVGRGAARLYQEMGEFERALEPLDALIKADPKDARLRIERASIAALAGRRAEALAGLSDARGLKPDLDARRRMAALYQDLKEDKQAAALLDGVIAESPADPVLRVSRASLAARSGDRETALKLLAEARGLNPDADARRRMAALYKDLRDFDLANLLSDELVKTASADAGLRLDRAALAIAAGDRGAALSSLDEARALGPDAAGLRRMAGMYGDLQEFPRAIALLDERIKESPGEAGLRLDRALLAVRAQDAPGALAALAAASKLNPDDVERRLMARLYRDAGSYGDAQGLLDELVRRAPGDAGLLVDRGELAVQAGDEKAARAFLARALDRGPDRADRHRIALARQALKDYAGALTVLAGLAKEKSEASVLGDIGVCKVLAGRPDEAISDLKSAIKLDPRSPAAYLTLASIYEGRGDYVQALAIYDSAPSAANDSALQQLLANGRREAAARARPPATP
jgi:tetratricopeptide (TPR) repeat protein